MILFIIMCTILTAMALVLIRAVQGCSAYDRILALNQFGTNTVLAIGVLVFIVEDPMYLDIALLYALINFATTIAFLRYYEYGSFAKEGREATQEHRKSDGLGS